MPPVLYAKNVAIVWIKIVKSRFTSSHQFSMHLQYRTTFPLAFQSRLMVGASHHGFLLTTMLNLTDWVKWVKIIKQKWMVNNKSYSYDFDYVISKKHETNPRSSTKHVNKLVNPSPVASPTINKRCLLANLWEFLPPSVGQVFGQGSWDTQGHWVYPAAPAFPDRLLIVHRGKPDF